MAPIFVRAGRVGDVPAGASIVVHVENRPVLLAEWEGRIFACVPICPHQHNPLDGARIEEFQLECPWHHFRYDLRTGENVYPRNVYPLGAPGIDESRLQADLHPLRLYPVQIRNGEIWIEIS